MILEEEEVKPRFYQRRRFWQVLFPLMSLVLLVIIFREDVSISWVALRDNRYSDAFSALNDLFVVLVLTGLLFLLLMLWVSQFILPVQSGLNRLRSFVRLLFYFFYMRGDTIFVKEGKIVSEIKERKIRFPGVALVDLSSALVVEKFLGAPGDAHDPAAGDDAAGEMLTPANMFRNRRPLLEIQAFGPGLVFTGWNQKVFGAVDLRKQVRIFPNVDAYTRDGLKVDTAIYSVFSISQFPDEIRITYAGGREQEHLRAVVVEKQVDAAGIEKEFVTALYKLNDMDALEVHRVQKEGFKKGGRPAPAPHAKQPFHFDAERVVKALYYAPYRKKGDELVHWIDLPNMAAIEIFRNMIAQYKFDVLYRPDDPKEFPLREFKKEFAFRVQCMGMMDYKLVARRDGGSIQVGDEWNEDMIISSPTQSFKGSQILRDRGIKVITAGFSELHPPGEVKQEMMENWKARWEKEIDSIAAQSDLEASRIRKRARVQAQQDTSFVYSDVFTKNEFSEEALTVRVFQALEAAATDVSEKRLLPHDTINMLYSLYSWMLGEEPDTKKDAGAGMPEDNLPGNQ